MQVQAGAAPPAAAQMQLMAPKGQVLLPPPPATGVHAPPVVGWVAGHMIGVTQFQVLPPPHVQVVAPNGHRLAALPPGTEVHAAPVTGSVAGHMIGTTQAQAAAAPPAPAVQVQSELVYGHRLAALPPATTVHMPPVAGAAAGHMIGPGGNGTGQFQVAAAPPLPALQVQVVAPNVHRLAPLPPGTTVHMSPVAGAAAGHAIGVTQFQAAAAPPPIFWQLQVVVPKEH